MHQIPEGESKREHARVSVRDSKIHGHGVVASTEILAGEGVLETDDSDPVIDRSILTPEEEILIDVFVSLDGSQRTTWMNSSERFINDSYDPSTHVQTDLGSGVPRTWALKQLRAGDEITWDHALNIWEEWVGPVTCHCGAEACRHVIRGNYLTLPREVQRRYLPLLDGPFRRRFTKEIEALDLASGVGRG